MSLKREEKKEDDEAGGREEEVGEERGEEPRGEVGNRSQNVDQRADPLWCYIKVCGPNPPLQCELTQCLFQGILA